MAKHWLVPAILLALHPSLRAQPVPGDVFREYRWFHEKGDAGQAMRVGSRQSTVYPREDAAIWPHDLDLEQAALIWPVALSCTLPGRGFLLRRASAQNRPMIWRHWRRSRRNSRMTSAG